MVDNNNTENEKSKSKQETVIPLSNNEYRYIQKAKNEEGRYVTTRDENYKAVETRILDAAEEDVAAKAIRKFTGKGPSTKYVKTTDNAENQKEE
jgi:hypothetical protein